MNLHTDVETQKGFLEAITGQKDELDDTTLEQNSDLRNAAHGIIEKDYNGDEPTGVLQERLETGREPVQTFYSFGANFRQVLDEKIDDPNMVTDRYLEKLGDGIVHKVQENRKSRIEKVGEVFDVISLTYDVGKANIQGMTGEKDADELFEEKRYTSRKEPVYGVKGELLTEAFVKGYQQVSENMSGKSYEERSKVLAASD